MRAHFETSRPAVQAPQTFGELAGSDLWKTASPSEFEPKGKWWEIFGDPQLNRVEEKIATSNYSAQAV